VLGPPRGGGDAVLHDVVDQPVHLVDLPTLRLTDLDRELAHPDVVHLEPLGAGDAIE
jgi:hypothetical protein